MDIVDTKAHDCRQKHRSQDDDGGAGIHDHAQDQEHDDADGKDREAGVEVSEDEVLDDLGSLSQGQHAAECGSEGKNECQAAVGLDRCGQEPVHVVELDGLVDEQGDDDRVEHGDRCCLSRSNEACVDSAEDDDRAEQSPEGILEQGAEAVDGELLHLGLDEVFVLTLGDAVDDGVDHHEAADQDARDDTGEEQGAGGNAGGQGVQDEGD